MDAFEADFHSRGHLGSPSLVGSVAGMLAFQNRAGAVAVVGDAEAVELSVRPAVMGLSSEAHQRQLAAVAIVVSPGLEEDIAVQLAVDTSATCHIAIKRLD